MVNCPKCGSGDIDLEYDDEGYVSGISCLNEYCGDEEE
jgi:Zn finger protein HypA/HybF involved in hydrogenase expression